MSKQAIRVEGLNKSFGEGDTYLQIMDNADFTVNKGELVALVAPSGAGKTTLLMMIGCVEEPTSGNIWIGDDKVYEDKWLTSQTRKIRREKIGFIFQAHYLIPFLNIIDNLTLVPQYNGVSDKMSKKKARDLLEYLGIPDKEKSMPSELSGGQNQRVAIARALANEPSIILADEPTAALDVTRAISVVKMLKQVALEQDVAIIMVTHDTRMLKYCDKTLSMENKKVKVIINEDVEKID
jgi:putative ABC transport system ATP-binding protein